MAANLNIKTALTGGAVNAVDRNTAGMKVDTSVCFACISGTPNLIYAYMYSASSMLTADGVSVIIPYGQSAGTAGRWILQGVSTSGGAETIAGVKTFASSPIIPDLTAFDKSTKAINSDYYWNNMPSLPGGFANLKVSTTGTSAVVTVTADALVLQSPSSGLSATLLGVSLTASTGAASGTINSLDTGSWAYSTLYNIFVVTKADGTGSGILFSTSATSPTMPTGYAAGMFARVGTVRTQSATNYNPLGIIQKGRSVTFKIASGTNVTTPFALISGIQGSPSAPTWVSASLTGIIPVTASKVSGVLYGTAQTTGAAMVAPSNGYGPYSSSTNPPPVFIAGGSGAWSPNQKFEFVLESMNLYYAAQTNSGYGVVITGYEDNL